MATGLQWSDSDTSWRLEGRERPASVFLEPMKNRDDKQAVKQRSRDLASQMSLRKKILFVLIINVVLFGMVEATTRVGYFFAYERSPYWLFYGVESFMADIDPEGHSVAMDGYVKFPASRVLQQYGMFAEATPVQINSAGLRGPDFEVQKAPGSIRVVSLGGSSTFGFFDRDGYTYPALLGQTFRERLPDGPPVEVINAGVPHAKIRHIRAMLEGEVVDYDPDFVTIYTGYNDALEVIEAGFTQRSAKWIHEHVLTVQLAKKVIRVLGGPRLTTSRWAAHAFQARPEYVERQIELHVERFDRELRSIVETAEANGIQPVFIKQAVNMAVRDEDESGPPMTYVERTKAAVAYLEAGERLSAEETTLAIHWHHNQVLETVAAELRVPIVDNAAILDRFPLTTPATSTSRRRATRHWQMPSSRC